MIHLRKLVWVLFWALWFISFSASKAQVLDPTQVYTTGNLVQPTIQGSNSTPWINGVYQDSLTCWAWGLIGYCGPNPIVRPGGDINFSYGWTDLYQLQSIASALPNSGTGLRVNGYNFSFTAKNGNSWDGGGTDVLYAYVQINDKSGNSLINHTHNLSYPFNWSNFNYNYNFTTPYLSSNLSTARYGFVGKDNNFWAGPYGPEINNVSFSLKYSVDPCTVNVLSSPSCPGYLTELAKLNTPAPSPSIDSQPVIQPALNEPTPSNNNPTTANTSTTNSSSTIQSAPIQSTPTLTASPSSERSVSGPSLSTILGIVRNEQSRIAGVESSAVSQANEAAAQASSLAQQQAESVASLAVSNSIGLSSQSNSIGSGITLNNSQTITGLNLSPANTNSIQGLRPQIQNQNIERENSASEASNSNSDFAVRSLIKDYLDEKPKMSVDTQPQGQRTLEVKRNVQDNEAAGGVNIAMLAKQPSGFELYQMGMSDNTFYPPKEIYRNQKTVDNERILRQLNQRSDRLHSEMVNEQYRTK